MYIEPNTSIYILKGVPLDPTYDHTIYWTYPTDQVSYFLGKAKHTLTRQMYQRSNKGSMRIKKKAEELYDCNYLMFQNTAFGNKWFFAFITSVNYINNEVSEVNYQIDVMQTYHFDYVLKPCFVEREHSETDNVGDNLVPENLDIGEYVYDKPTTTGYLDNVVLIIACTFNNNYEARGGAVYGGLYSGLVYHVYNENQYQDAELFIQNAGNASDGFVSMFYYPADMMPDPGSLSVAKVQNIQKNKVVSGSIAGHQVVNKKLFTYPYNYLYVTNLQGNAAEYRYEFFEGNACNFLLSGDYVPQCTMILRPNGYKSPASGLLDPEPFLGNVDEMLTLSGWGQVPFATDSYKAWLAQTASNALSKSIATGLSAGVASLIGGNALYAAGAALASQAATVGEMAVRSFLQAVKPQLGIPNQAHGNFSLNPLLALGYLDFYFYNKHITREYAEIIDGYFTRYGYACHKLKEPNRNARPEFNYVKTSDCLIEASDLNGYGMPADDEATICGIYNNGITFWKNPAHIGDYTVNNAPTNQ